MEACPACGRIAGFFLDSKLTPLFIVASLLVGFLAVMVIPREEEPQIIVPMLDVTTSMPGASPEEVEQRVTTPLESILHEISGVEFVYSTSSPGRSLVIVRFLVGTREEDALIKVYSKLYANGDKLPATASQPIVKLRSIDNVPILSLTMWGAHYSSAQLRSLAAAFQSSIQQVPEVSETQLIGGQPRALRVLLSDQKLEAYSISAEQVVSRICAANAQVEAGQFASGNQEIRVDAGEFIHSKDDLDRVTVGVSHGSPVYLRDVAANILDGPKDPTSYVSFGPAVGTKIEGTLPGSTYPAVTITVAKRKGTNATYVANAVLAKIAGMRKTTIPADLNITPTRNYGDTAKAKSDEGVIVRNDYHPGGLYRTAPPRRDAAG